MNNEFFEIVNALSDKRASNFLSKTHGDAKGEIVINQVVRDLSWLDMLEECIPYLDAIVRNPRRFIVQEEEIIPVEKTKKVTEESIKHLAKHTSLIQDIDKDGDVKPLKLLNVFKEETTDLYENRFIYSLIVNTKTFLNNQLEHTDLNLKSKYLKNIFYTGETTLASEKISFDVKMQSEYYENSDENIKNIAINERINRIIEIFNDFLRTKFIKELSGASPVRSPIRKTNVILKDKNFQKAVELWEFIEKFDIEASTKVIEMKKEEEIYNLANNIKIGTYVQYYAATSVSKQDEKFEEYDLTLPHIRKIIEAYVREHHTDEKKFKAMINREFRLARDKRQVQYEEIKSVFKSNIEKHKRRLQNALSFLN